MDPWKSAENTGFAISSSANSHVPTDSYSLPFDPVLNSLDIQTAGVGAVNEPFQNESLFEIAENLKSSTLEENNNSFNDPVENDNFEFDYTKLLKHQYIVFQDYDIVNILSYLISLPDKYQHDITIPATVIFQCSRYIDLELKNPNYLSNFIDLVCQKIQSAIQPPAPSATATNNSDTSSKNKTASSKPQTVDLVRKSYWLGAISLLYFYFYKEQNTWFYKNNPQVLQKIIDLLNFLIIQVCVSIHENISDNMIEEVLFNYTSIDQQETIYKSSWNIFSNKKLKNRKLKEKGKSKHKSDNDNNDGINEQENQQQDSTNDDETTPEEEKDNPSTQNTSYEDIIKFLYPPSLEEQYKSPMKICQIFSALIYCLDLHCVHKVFQQQCLSLTIKWFTTNVFNKILKNKSKNLCCRAKAIQIRLNLTMIQDWIKSNGVDLPKPTDSIDLYMWERFPDTLVLNTTLKKVLHVQTPSSVETIKTITDEKNSLFYYQPLPKLSNVFFQKLFELLEWLQVMSSLKDDASLQATIDVLEDLNVSQLLRVVDKYKYEIDEPVFKMKKNLKKLLQKTKEENDAMERELFELYLPEREFPIGIVLPTMVELMPVYNTSRDYAPFLPLQVQDYIETIHDNNESLQNKLNESATNNSDAFSISSVCAREEDGTGSAEGLSPVISLEKDVEFHPTNIFDNLKAPAQATSKNPVVEKSVLEDFEQNPW